MNVLNLLKKITFKLPRKSRIAIIDEDNSVYIRRILLEEDATIIPARQEAYYFHPCIFIKILKYMFLKGCRFGLAHKLALLEYIGAKVAITLVDHNNIMGVMSEVYPIPFICVQHSIRDSVACKAMTFVPEYYCYGPREIQLFDDLGIKYEKMIPVGSLKTSYFHSEIAKNSPDKEYDLCLVSQWRPHYYDGSCDDRDPIGMEIMFGHIERYLDKNPHLRFGIGLSDRGEPEKAFFRERFGERANLVQNDSKDFGIYRIADDSKITLTYHSSVATEALGWGARVFIVDHEISKIQGLPPLKSELIQARNSTYEEFSSKLDQLFKVDEGTYQESIKEDRAFINCYNPDDPGHKRIKNRIKSILSESAS